MPFWAWNSSILPPPLRGYSLLGLAHSLTPSPTPKVILGHISTGVQGASTLGTSSKRGRQRQRQEVKKIFLSNSYILLSIYLYFGSPVHFYFRSNYFDSSISFWVKWWMLVLEMSTTFWRQCGNEAVEVSFQRRTAQTSDSRVLFVLGWGWGHVQTW